MVWLYNYLVVGYFSSCFFIDFISFWVYIWDNVYVFWEDND